MGCPYGSEPKPGVTGYRWIDAGNPDESQTRPWWYGFGILPRWAEPVEVLCSQSPPVVDPFDLPEELFVVGDVLEWIANQVANFTNYARAKAWHRWCRCKSLNPNGTIVRIGCSYIEFVNLANVRGHGYECGEWTTVPGTFGLEFTRNGVRTGIEVLSATIVQNVALGSQIPNPGFETRYGSDCIGCPEESVIVIPDLPVPPEIPKPPEIPPLPPLIPCEIVLACVTEEFIKNIIDCDYINGCVEVKQMDWESINVDIIQCTSQGYQPNIGSVLVPKNDGGSLKGAIQLLFNQLSYQAIHQKCLPTNNDFVDYVISGVIQTDIDLPPGCYRIESTLLTLPQGKGRRFGSDSSSNLDDKFALGEFSFQNLEGYNTTTQPLQFVKQLIPVDLDGRFVSVRFYVDPGIELRIRMFYRGEYGG